MVGWTFATLKPERVCAVCQPENTPSSTVMERLGMTFTGLGRWYDMDCRRYDITAAQWSASPAKARYDAEA
jgi:RimJ/RimL family protein N-acetyltransferase